jgi:RHS repeat-associated protein
LAFIENNQCYFYHNDHLGTPQELTDWEGRVVWSARYRVYGNIVRKDVEQVENNIRFQGQYYDQETGLHYNRFRYYDPGTGQFVQPDPIGLLGGINNYRYAPNSTGWTDPLGLSCKENKYESTSMLEDYAGENEKYDIMRWNRGMGRVTEYFDSNKAALHELDVKDGLLVHKTSGVPFDSINSSSIADEGKSIFVMDPQGRIFASKKQIPGELHHSSFLGGNPVSSAGDLMVTDGILLEVSNKSGHYQPSQKLNSQIFNELEKRGMDKDRLDSVYRSGFGDDGYDITPEKNKYFLDE